MNTLDFLQRRRSCKKFGDIAPNRDQLEHMFKAALRAPDHGRLKPYRFVVIENKQALYQALLAAVTEFNLGERGLEKAEKLSSQAPTVVAAIAKLDDQNKKVPAWEQMVTTGCATYALQLAANVQGFETVWISKHWVQGKAMREMLTCKENEKVIGLILIGSPQDKAEITTATETENTEGFVCYLEG
ncbi:nitroreductase family protein [Bibersteinia trehalosi]|uniref:nitroreductase family protein n=1 Tax=Bibersteinia trehalosi TaxID=47735 RepID=UPI002D78ADF5|nr:nitroreductase family protein [Bibersteinia trehalosi]